MAGSTEDHGSTTSNAPSSSKPSDVRFACACLNVTITASSPDVGHVGDSSSDQPHLTGSDIRVWLDKDAEHCRHPLYVSYDTPDLERGSRRPSAILEAENAREKDQMVKRICWLCETALYTAKGKRKEDPGVEEGWVTIDTDSGIWLGPQLEAAQQSTSLPYSSLLLPIADSASNFGRPPQASLTTLYPASSPSTSSRASNLLPRIPDPFFLPPPFIPAHPHLKDLCDSAVSYLHERHVSAENEVKAFIEAKAREIQDAEEKVRKEVEFMWEKYIEGPGRGTLLERRRSSSISRSTERSGRRDSASTIRRGTPGKGVRSPILSPNGADEKSSSPQPTENPILREASLGTYTGGASLLSASISQMSYLPPPPPVPDQVDHTIDETIKTFAKTGDERAVAMSYIFSSLDGAMGGTDRKVKTKNRKGHSRDGLKDGKPDGVVADGDRKGNSWIDETNQALAASGGDAAGTGTEAMEDGEDAEGRTPKAGLVRGMSPKKKERKGSLLAEGGGRGKEKGRVTFEEAAPEGESEPATQNPVVDDEDYVFDFELEDSSTPIPGSSATATSDHPDISRSRNIIEQTLSTTFAADIPSHRAAYNNLKRRGNNPYDLSLRRKESDENDTGSTSSASDRGSEDDSAISKLATSMPVAIVLANRPTRQPVLHPLERKTSLTDRQGVLVPPLIKAMRQRGLDVQRSESRDVPGTRDYGAVGGGGANEGPGRSMQRRGSRTASASREREREQVRGFKADPGAVFESLADEGDDGDDAREDEDGSEVLQGDGTVRENRGFVPPHLLARKESAQSQDVGWRSMISD